MKPGVHRAIARDGRLALVIVAKDGRVVEIVQAGRTDPPSRPSTRYLGRSLRELMHKAEARRIAAIADEIERRSAVRRSIH